MIFKAIVATPWIKCSVSHPGFRTDAASAPPAFAVLDDDDDVQKLVSRSQKELGSGGSKEAVTRAASGCFTLVQVGTLAQMKEEGLKTDTFFRNFQENIKESIKIS